MKKQLIIEYSWRNMLQTDIPIDHQEQLEIDALQRIYEMQNDGYTSGELHSDVNEIEYQGWWSLITKTL